MCRNIAAILTVNVSLNTCVISKYGFHEESFQKHTTDVI